MPYKTIVLELLRQEPQLHKQLRITGRLRPTMESYARQLKASHEAWKETIAQAKPGSHPSQIASEALEMAIQELENCLKSASPSDEPRPPGKAMACVRRPPSNA
jgi:hypothetical protein